MTPDNALAAARIRHFTTDRRGDQVVLDKASGAGGAQPQLNRLFGAVQNGVVGHLDAAQLEADGVPGCPECAFALKPKVVLFGEDVAELESVRRLAADCDVLLVIGTSAQVYPAATLPGLVARQGGSIIEMNREPSLARATGTQPDFFLGGDIVQSLPRLLQELELLS